MMDSLILVNEQDQEVGQAEKLFVHRRGLLHRAFSVFVCRRYHDQTEILLQKRHRAKYHSGGLWSNTCCGHPSPGETTQIAAQRRLFEEMGLELVLQEIGVFHYQAIFTEGLIENEIDHVLIGWYNDESLVPHPDEVEAITWSDIHQVFEVCQRNPQEYTAWFKDALNLVLSSMNQR